jgi:hypothetical protein
MHADIETNSGGSTPGGSYNTIFFATILGLPHLIAPGMIQERLIHYLP